MAGEDLNSDPSKSPFSNVDELTFGSIKRLFAVLNQTDQQLQQELPVIEATDPGPLAPIEQQHAYAKEAAVHRARQAMLADIRLSLIDPET